MAAKIQIAWTIAAMIQIVLVFCRHVDWRIFVVFIQTMGGGCHNLNVGECTRLSTDSGRVTATIFIKIVEG